MRLNGDEKLIFEEPKENIDNPIYLSYNDGKMTLTKNKIEFEGTSFGNFEELYNYLRGKGIMGKAIKYEEHVELDDNGNIVGHSLFPNEILSSNVSKEKLYEEWGDEFIAIDIMELEPSKDLFDQEYGTKFERNDK